MGFIVFACIRTKTNENPIALLQMNLGWGSENNGQRLRVVQTLNFRGQLRSKFLNFDPTSFKIESRALSDPPLSEIGFKKRVDPL